MESKIAKYLKKRPRSRPSLQLAVLGGDAPGFLHGVFLGVLQHLGADDLIHVKAALGSELEGIVDDIREFFLDLLDVCFLWLFPEEYLEELGCFDGKGHREVLRVVELVPVPLLREPVDVTHQVFD